MKAILRTSVIAIVAATALNIAPASSADKGAKPGAGMPVAMNPQQMQQMQQSMMQMHDLMHRIQAAKSPEERQKLQQQQMQLMQSHMQMMMSMMMQGMGGQGGMMDGQQMPMDHSNAPARK